MGALSLKQDLWTWLRSCDAANVVTHALITCLPPCHAHPPPVCSWKWKLAAGGTVSSSLIIGQSPMWRQTDRSRWSHRRRPVQACNLEFVSTTLITCIIGHL